MLDKILSFIANFMDTFDKQRGVNNTKDTWVPVWNNDGSHLQHRVIPRNIIEIRRQEFDINRAFGSSIAISAPSITEFTFVAWVAVDTVGWVGSCYVTDPTHKDAKIFNATTGQTGTGRVYATALYKANF